MVRMNVVVDSCLVDGCCLGLGFLAGQEVREFLMFCKHYRSTAKTGKRERTCTLVGATLASRRALRSETQVNATGARRGAISLPG